jgi:hypothetical protein
MSLREAAQQALEALEDEPNAMVEWKPNHWEYKRNLAITALRTALAEPEQEPVAWMNVWGDLLRHHPAEYGRNDEHEGWKPLYPVDDTALLRQCLDALESDHPDIQLRTSIALRERLGEKA